MSGKPANHLRKRWKIYLLLLLIVIFIILLCFFVVENNLEIVKILLPFIFIFIVGGFLFGKEYLGSYITTISIIFAILFFLFQHDITQKNLFETILIINEDNCRTAQELINNLNEHPDGVDLTEGYIVNIYKDNIAFIYDKFGREKGKKILVMTDFMEATNNTIKNSQFLANLNTDVKNMSPSDKKMFEFYGNLVKELSIKIIRELKDVSKDYRGYENICIINE